ncbi:hypothetical protein NDU88_007662 [Pleurodeles waltl]|uniref:Uncharacterized protein n=1 Tax=Pleurodeles waltl TaxID=8319 RepID=A0AAV7U0Q4_PLEWA|nr:hypothetical protein NDU88_007662 [Pleurodeles waltl]
MGSVCLGTQHPLQPPSINHVNLQQLLSLFSQLSGVPRDRLFTGLGTHLSSVRVTLGTRFVLRTSCHTFVPGCTTPCRAAHSIGRHSSRLRPGGLHSQRDLGSFSSASSRREQQGSAL